MSTEGAPNAAARADDRVQWSAVE